MNCRVPGRFSAGEGWERSAFPRDSCGCCWVEVREPSEERKTVIQVTGDGGWTSVGRRGQFLDLFCTWSREDLLKDWTPGVGKTNVHAPQAGKTLEEHIEISNLAGIKDLKAS